VDVFQQQRINEAKADAKPFGAKDASFSTILTLNSKTSITNSATSSVNFLTSKYPNMISDDEFHKNSNGTTRSNAEVTLCRFLTTGDPTARYFSKSITSLVDCTKFAMKTINS